MATGTAAIIPPARQDPRQVANTLRHTINWDDAGVAAGVPFANSLPQGAFILDVLVEIVTTFDGNAPVLTVGTVGPAYNNIVAAADVNEGAAAVTRVTTGLGRGLAAAGDVTPFAKLALDGATKGQAVIAILYEGGFAS